MKKSVISLIAAVLLCGCADNSGIYREEKSEISVEEKLPAASESDFEFTETDDGIAITKFVGSQKEFAVPEKIGGKPVVELRDKAFSERTDIEKVEVPETVAKIGKSGALKFCEGSEETGAVILTGGDVKDARAYYDSVGNVFTVQLTFTPSGAEKFSEATERLVGETVSIWLDGKLLSAPTIRERIYTEKATISGGFTSDEAMEIAEKINGNPFFGCEKIQVEYKGKTYGYNELSNFCSAV